MTSIFPIAAAVILVLASLSEAAPAKSNIKRANQLPGLSNIKHVVYFMQVSSLLEQERCTYTNASGLL